MSTSKKITVLNTEISVLIGKDDNDYISLTDMVKANEGEDHIRNWMRNNNTLEYLGVWESLNNPRFKGVEFDGFRNSAGLNAFATTAEKKKSSN